MSRSSQKRCLTQLLLIHVFIFHEILDPHFGLAKYITSFLGLFGRARKDESLNFHGIRTHEPEMIIELKYPFWELLDTTH